MKNTLTSLTCFFLGLLVCSRVQAQIDPHFSEYYMYPSWLNPALTGAIDGDYRVSGIYRNQWNNTFSTVGASGEYVTDKNINIGASLLQQSTGDAGYTYSTAYASLAYTGVRLGATGNHRIVFGMQAGMISRRFNQSKLVSYSQIDPNTGAILSGSGDTYPNASATVFDAGAGVMYFDATPDQKVNVFGGFSASHLTQAESSFGTGSAKEKLPIRYTLHGGAKIVVSDVVSITPNFLYLKENNAEEKMLGAYVQMKANATTDLMLGANYRLKDAFVPFVGFYHERFVLGIAYDVTASDLSKAVPNTNSFEISLSFTGKKTKNYPSEHFVCPRL